MLQLRSLSRGKRLPLSASVLALAFITVAAPAADLPDAKDHPLLKRFGGSEIVGYDVKRFDRSEVQTSTYKGYSFAKKSREYAKPPLAVEGTVTRIWYEAAGQASAVELLRNYRNELLAQKFQVLYDSGQDPAATRWIGYFNDLGPKTIRTSRSHYVFYAARDSAILVCSAVLKRPEGDVYAQLTAVQWDKDHPTYKARQGAYIAVEIVEEKAMTQNMVVVSAGEMAKAIGASGRVALYGILFDFNKADIKPESRPALAEIAGLLKSDPALKLHVVGHTDNIGGLESNLSLSKKRADAVVQALARDFGVAPARLQAHGLAFLAPVAVNTSEEGRARNRRVELVPQ
jgi:outer membrane protein OmpA-like peptidoglycan-associated protein